MYNYYDVNNVAEVSPNSFRDTGTFRCLAKKSGFCKHNYQIYTHD